MGGGHRPTSEKLNEGTGPYHGPPHHTRRPERVSRTRLAAPYLESRRHAHQRPVILGQPAQLVDDVVHLGMGCQPGPDHRFPCVLHRDLRHQLALALAEGGHDEPDAYLHHPGLERHPQQAHPDRRVPPSFARATAW